ncbi:hypothetical protein AVE30378_06150 [Achromobacter veterisilvae]|uniref:Uncharacterized protein n=2 Tax=Achromobacter veterisilvae TaxID=2069367 RepID=A0A446D160_9BURK|nr:hypothetical protein [Achromobacter veterisilvae]SSW73803.1 hypothetical protein AVE30378_06150 [Achromobacter veterisilvae]
MSRHYFDTVHKGFPITVVLGWDRPMNYFFLFIEKPTELIDDTAKVESDPFNHDLDYYRVVLCHFQIDVPESMFTEVQQDCEGNVGNRVVKHQADGSFTEQTF